MRLGDARIVGLLVTVLVTGSCAVSEPVASLTDEGRAWPAPPEAARVQFVAEFSRPADLGIRPSFWSRVVGVAAGARDDRLVRPMGVTATPDGQVIFVADPDAGCVHRFNLARGRYDCLMGADEAVLTSPVGLSTTATGRLYVADSGQDRVYLADPADKTLRPVFLTPAPVRPTGLAVGPAGDLFITNTGNHTVRRYNSDGGIVSEFGGRGNDAGEMNYPTYLWLSPAGELLVSDTMNFRIQRFDVDDGFLGAFGFAGDGSGSLARPKGVAMDKYGHIYVVDGGNHAVQIFNRSGQFLLAVGEQGQEAGEFWLPSDIHVTPENLIFVADSYNQRIQIFRYVGEAS